MKEDIIAPINEELNIEKYETNNIKNMIYTVRGKQVMVDHDVALLYHYTTKRINEAVRRNKERFLENFCFQLNEDETEILRSQIATASNTFENKFRNKKYLPYVFTEQGIAMISGLLKSEIAIKVSIMNAFVEMRKFIIDIIKKAKEKILIIDNYIDDSILEMLKKKNKNVEVVILTSSKCNILKLDISKFNKQYPILKIAKNDNFHDRFIVIDNNELYHIGASLKDLGKKCFAISKIEDAEYIERIASKI